MIVEFKHKQEQIKDPFVEFIYKIRVPLAMFYNEREQHLSQNRPEGYNPLFFNNTNMDLLDPTMVSNNNMMYYSFRDKNFKYRAGKPFPQGDTLISDDFFRASMQKKDNEEIFSIEKLKKDIVLGVFELKTRNVYFIKIKNIEKVLELLYIKPDKPIFYHMFAEHPDKTFEQNETIRNKLSSYISFTTWVSKNKYIQYIIETFNFLQKETIQEISQKFHSIH